MKLIKILDNKDNIVLVADRKTTLSFLHSKIKDFEKPLLRSLTSIRLRSVEDIQIRHKFYKECLKHIASNTDQYGKVGYFSYSSESMPNIMMRGHHRIKCGEWGSRMTYLEECTKYFAPLDKISEALDNHEGIKGFSNDELIQLVCDDKELQYDLCNQRGG